MKRVITYIKMEQRGKKFKLNIEEVGNDVQLKQRIKTLNGDKGIFDIKLTKIVGDETSIMRLYLDKCLNFARFTPEASIYLEKNYEAKKTLKMRKINTRDLYEFDITWVKDYCKSLGDDDE